MTLLVPESGVEKSDVPLGRPSVVVAAASPGATDHPARGRTDGSANHNTRYPPAVEGASVLNDSATLVVGRSKRPLAKIAANGTAATTSAATESPAANWRHPKPAWRRSFSSA